MFDFYSPSSVRSTLTESFCIRSVEIKCIFGVVVVFYFYAVPTINEIRIKSKEYKMRLTDHYFEPICLIFILWKYLIQRAYIFESQFTGTTRTQKKLNLYQNSTRYGYCFGATINALNVFVFVYAIRQWLLMANRNEMKLKIIPVWNEGKCS